MTDPTLSGLATAAGILTDWIDYRGEHQTVGDDTLRALLEALDLPCASAGDRDASLARVRAEADARRWQSLVIAEPGAVAFNGGIEARVDTLSFVRRDETGARFAGTAERGEDGRYRFVAPTAPGYYEVEAGDHRFTLAVAPTRCYGVGDVAGGARPWGLAAQLYGLRRKGDGGIGDFTALSDFARAAAGHGADAVAVSPMHALFAADVSRFSPYSPSSRLFLNALHVDPAAVFGAARVASVVADLRLHETLEALESQSLVDWPTAARARMALLRALYPAMSAMPQVQTEFEAYIRTSGPALRDHARFEALHGHFAGIAGHPQSWQQWPAEYRDCEATAVAEFASAHAEEVRFHQFLQWLAERGLQSAQDAARSAGMRIGLIGDLAVGTDGGGSHAWSRQHDLLQGISVGAPPDLINALGQSWGLTTFSPRALQLHGYAPYIEMLRSQLRHVGGLRIDHVIGLNRLWLVPAGAESTHGAYLRYPLEDLLRLAALESWRSRSILVGEDMGTVPEGFRERMSAANLLGMRVLWFERDWGLFVEPSRWPTTAMAMTSTHDLPTVAGWWQERDIEWRARLGLFGPHSDEPSERAARAQDRVKLWSAFQYAGVAAGSAPAVEETAAVIEAASAFVASTPAPLVLLPVEDVVGLPEQANIPGTIDEHPNWRRRLPQDVTRVLEGERVTRQLAKVNAMRRGHGGGSGRPETPGGAAAVESFQ